MVKKLKKIIKGCLSFFYNPILYTRLCMGGSKNIILGKNIRIKNSKYLHVASNTTICDNARFLFVDDYHGGKYQPYTSIGKNVFITYNFTLMAAAPINIGDNVLIASNVMITSENHGIDPLASISYADTPLSGKSVIIGDGCWLGEKVMIMPGVTLGKRCIVAAGAVVTKSYPDYTMIAGVPAKIIKQFDLVRNAWVNV